MLRIKADEKMVMLQDERDYFRAEAARLDRELKQQHEQVRRLQEHRTDR